MDIPEVEIERGLRAVYGSGGSGRGCPRISDVTLLGSGFETDVFAFSLEAAGESAGQVQDLVLRVYAGEGTAEKAAREFGAMRRLREAGYPVPQVLTLTHDASPFGRPFVIMERIHGVSLGSRFWSAPEEQRRESQAMLYRLIARLHALDGSAILPDSPLAASGEPCDFSAHELSGLAALLHRLEGREPPSLRDTLAWLHSRGSTVPCERLSVVHGDFHHNNVLLRADGAPFVIDWSNVRLADYRADLAWTWLITRLSTRAAARTGDGEAELRLYAQLAGREVTHMACFEAAACTRLLLSVLISLQFGAARQGMRPEAGARMRREADLIRYVAALLQERTGIAMPDLEATLSALAVL
jgi:aminoglycoside phosphotransferase (APT) family kinase protein